MAKQTFTTGQVLLASQLTSLQQTAMLGGAASNKTSSYTLVAADAGTAISMTSTSATTITVNTGLFAAGDTVQITNLGSGVSTITPGTATVNTAASLALAQYESGTLDFDSTSSAIFIKGAGAVAASGGMTLISTTTLTGASVTLSSIPQTYNHLQLILQNARVGTSNPIGLRFNSDATANRHAHTTAFNGDATFNDTSGRISAYEPTTASISLIVVDIYNYTNTTTQKFGTVFGLNNETGNEFSNANIAYNQTGAISSLVLLIQTAGSWTSGTALLYGVK